MTNDPIVLACRDKLLELKFGWIKFLKHKTAKYCPGFVYPPDADGLIRAQAVTIDGYVSNTKQEFDVFAENIPDIDKKKPEIATLKKFNKQFNFSYI